LLCGFNVTIKGLNAVILCHRYAGFYSQL